MSNRNTCEVTAVGTMAEAMIAWFGKRAANVATTQLQAAHAAGDASSAAWSAIVRTIHDLLGSQPAV